MRVLLSPDGRDLGREFDVDDDSSFDHWYGVARPAGPGRPWVALSMIASLDGSASVGGLSGALGATGDRAVFAALRRAAAIVLVGAGTAAAENYGPPRRAGQRIAVVTARGTADVTGALFTSGAGLLVMPASRTVPGGVEAVLAGEGAVDLAAALIGLGDRSSVEGFVQAEGGPTLNGSLLDAGCVDELNITFAPMLVGGQGPRIVTGAYETTRGFSLAHLLGDDEGYLYGRWVRRAS